MRVKGYQRDTVYFSILDDEWPAVKGRLEARLEKTTGVEDNPDARRR